MEGPKFDALAREIASRRSRRTLLRGLAGAVGASLVALTGREASAKPTPVPRPKPSCLKAGRQCAGIRSSRKCCSETCCDGRCCDEGETCAGRSCCPKLQTCDDICCPPETVGCTEFQLPSGPVIGCLCPGGSQYDFEKNECRVCADQGGACATDAGCCDDLCCGGVCCPDGLLCTEAGCCDDDHACGDRCCPLGTFCSDGACQAVPCPPGTNCSGSAECSEYSSVKAGLCCQYPNYAVCACDSKPGAGDGFVVCCDPYHGLGTPCPPIPNTDWGAGGAVQACPDPDDLPGCCDEGNVGGSVSLAC